MERPESSLTINPEYKEQPLVFEAGNIIIRAISDAPTGMQYESRKNKLRRGELRDRPFNEIVQKDSDLWHQLGQSVRKDVDFALRESIGPLPTTISTGNEAQDLALDKLKNEREMALQNSLTPEEYAKHAEKMKALEGRMARVARIHNLTDDERRKYMDKYAATHKLGIRYPMYDEATGTLTGSDVAIPYWFYKLLANKNLGPEYTNLGAIAAGTLNLITADGKVIKQKRSEKNQKFKRNLGNSASGLQDSRFNHGEAGKPMAPTQESLLRGNLKELGEEIGIKPDIVLHGKKEPVATDYALAATTTDDILSTAKARLELETLVSGPGDKKIELFDFKILGLAEDPLSPHDEFLMFGRINLTAQEVIDRARRARRHAAKNDRDFAEHFIVMDATPEAFENILTDPNFADSPPTHAACDLVTGRYLMMEREGIASANAWMEKIKPGVDMALEESKRRKKEFLALHPEILEQFPHMNTEEYDPNYNDIQNGFKPLDERIAESKIEADIDKVYDHAYMFDCDGVLTGLDEKALRFPEILDELANLLDNSTLSLCSGRPAKWIMDELVNPLIARIDATNRSRNLLQNLCIIAESGGIIIDINKQGEFNKQKNTALSVPTELQQMVKRLVEVKYSDTMFIDEDKETMVTAERNKQTSQEDFQIAQAQFIADAKVFLRQYLNGGGFTIDGTKIATDFKHENIDKSIAAQLYIDWMKRKGITAKKFEVMGDSESDALMAVGIHNEGKDVTYFHVDKDSPKELYDFPVIHQIKINDSATLDFLKGRDKAPPQQAA